MLPNTSRACQLYSIDVKHNRYWSISPRTTSKNYAFVIFMIGQENWPFQWLTSYYPWKRWRGAQQETVPSPRTAHNNTQYDSSPFRHIVLIIIRWRGVAPPFLHNMVPTTRARCRPNERYFLSSRAHLHLLTPRINTIWHHQSTHTNQPSSTSLLPIIQKETVQ